MTGLKEKDGASVLAPAWVFPTVRRRMASFIYEGVLLFGLLWLYSRKPRGLGQVSGAFLAIYGAQRFVIEYFREPDAFLGLRWLNLSQGQWYCLPMIAAGLAMWFWGRGRIAKGQGA